MPTSPLASLFGRSPFTGLQQHMRVVTECAQHVTPLIDALCAEDQAKLEHHAKEIFRLEEEADKVKHDIRKHLPRSLFMPVDRRDLLEVLHAQDSIADTAQDIAGILLERDMTPHDEFVEPLKALVAACVGVVDQGLAAIEMLDELVEVGFRGRTADRVDELLDGVNTAEDHTDELGMQLARALFQREDDLKPVTVMLWYRQIEWIGDLADHAEKVANRLRLIIAR